MIEQKQLWDNKGEIDHYSTQPTDFTQEVLMIISPTTKVLELGCGVGNDSIAFAQAGYSILATDFSEVAISNNSTRF